MDNSSTILQTILQHKQLEVAARQKLLPLAEIQDLLATIGASRGFVNAIKKRVDAKQDAVIAEVKKASPSKGIIRKNFDPLAIAESYEKAGATCLSVLTDEQFFQGADTYLQLIREHTHIPLLRKDFIVDAYQIYESKLIGADCILLIVAALSSAQLLEFYELAKQLQLDVLIEVHNAAELDIALQTDAVLIGINNRDLHTFNTDIQTTIQLAKSIADNRIIVTESGIHTANDVALLHQHNIHAFLVGEAFMRADDPGKALQALFATAR